MIVIGGSADMQQESHGSFQEFPQVIFLLLKLYSKRMYHDIFCTIIKG